MNLLYFLLVSLLGYYSRCKFFIVALGDILGRSTCRPRVICVYSNVSTCFPILKRRRFSHFLFTSPSRCCFSFLATTTWPREPSTPALSHQSTSAHRHTSQNHAPILRIVGLYGISFGAALLQSSHALGWPCIQIFLVPGRERQRIVLKDGYGIHFYRLQNIASCCSYVHCWYPSTSWLGLSDSSWVLGR